MGDMFTIVSWVSMAKVGHLWDLAVAIVEKNVYIYTTILSIHVISYQGLDIMIILYHRDYHRFHLWFEGFFLASGIDAEVKYLLGITSVYCLLFTRWARLRPPYWPVGSGLHHGRNVDQKSHNARQHWAAPAHSHQSAVWLHHCWGEDIK